MLQTERLQFKPYLPEYRLALEKLCCENELVMKSTLKGRTFTKVEFESLINEEFIRTTKDAFGFWCVTDKADGSLVGISGIHPCHYQGDHAHEFGFILHQDYWGKGLATEIGNFWLTHAQSHLKLPKLVATVHPNNTASRNVLEKLGLNFISTFTAPERGERCLYSKVVNS
ncbi:GNAT family N-acetyltransferase [Cellulophaga baltica]|uniref:Protein N-acetyltransferase, RimJ/RimL family n=1 Tax=Cellulophaga baltica TaxID=76594 RepID=A0A1G7FHH0_9FLAO|nr:GNAT family N-acetyltransferase [Cellulophaga baltica]SDE75364.1 Protein N-acetyltransferase, RimJ/RimL family [Cellulophaga baltica]